MLDACGTPGNNLPNAPALRSVQCSRADGQYAPKIMGNLYSELEGDGAKE